VLKIAREIGWGYARVLGELRKPGVRAASKTTPANILREARLDPGPKRGPGTWSDFVARHAATLWACDFLSVRGATRAGFVEFDILFFLHVGTRWVIVSGVTASPDAAWVAQPARNASMQMAEWGLPASHLLLDHDAKFTREFDAVFEDEGVEVTRVGPQAPNLNAYAERWVERQAGVPGSLRDVWRGAPPAHPEGVRGSLQRGAAAPGPRQPSAARRPGRRRGPAARHAIPRGEVRCRERLGGLLRHYHRHAA
jgi:putative transposase